MEDRPALRSVCLSHGRILVGTKNGEIVQVDKEGAMVLLVSVSDKYRKIPFNGRKFDLCKLVQGHGCGELWGLAVHPTQYECTTVSDDGYLKQWTFASGGKYQCTRVLNLRAPARCVEYSLDASMIGVGFKDGELGVYGL
jgi:hypothetical protein